ncbi:MAG: HNH endonuclease [Chthoniobacterales bacterium]|nr:HNH endonuclease [Chthoniobacterales bacterium]
MARFRDQRNKIKRLERMVEARKKGTHTKEEWGALVKSCGAICVKCGIDGRKVEKDHIIPVYQGGSDSIENIQPLCAWCNAGKGPETKNWKAIRRAAN